MGRKVEIGDVIEVETPIGLAFAQFVNEDPTLGELIRVLPGTYERSPVTLADLVAGPDRFVVFYPVRAAIRQRLVARVGTFEVPVHAREFPVMLWGGLRLRDGRMSSWSLYDGKTTTLLKEILPEHRGLPIVMTMLHKGLVNAVVNDWRPVDELDGDVGLQKLVGADVVLPRNRP